MKILFVCTGNSCRSPMAAAIAGRVFEDKKIDAEVRSVGISANDGFGASANALEAVEKYGADLSRHVTRGFTPEELEWADLVITMTRSHKAMVLRMSGSATEKVFTIYEYAENSQKDVQDPFMCGLDVYEECAAEIFRLIGMISDRMLKKEEL